MLADPSASEEVVFGADGVLSALSAGCSYLDHSTIDEASSTKISEHVTAQGARFLAAPVSGGWRDAAKGELLFICGGSRDLFDESTKDGSLAEMGHRHWFVGESPGSAARAKLMLQIVMGSYVGALAESLALSEKAGEYCANIIDHSSFNPKSLA